jgi:hypothetical protein
MKTKTLWIAFRAATAFKVRCRSAAWRAGCRAAEWPDAKAGMGTKRAVPDVMATFRQERWPADNESRLERGVPPNKVKIKPVERTEHYEQTNTCHPQ